MVSDSLRISLAFVTAPTKRTSTNLSVNSSQCPDKRQGYGSDYFKTNESATVLIGRAIPVNTNNVMYYILYIPFAGNCEATARNKPQD